MEVTSNIFWATFDIQIERSTIVENKGCRSYYFVSRNIACKIFETNSSFCVKQRTTGIV